MKREHRTEHASAVRGAPTTSRLGSRCFRASGPILLAAVLSACASTHETPQGRTATEQLLLAKAADGAIRDLVLPLPYGSRVFVDMKQTAGEGATYALSALRGAVSTSGYGLADRREDADAVLEVRTGGLALDQMRRQMGLPEMTVPISDSLNVVSVPEVSVYSSRDRIGVAEFSAFLYDPRTGRSLGAVPSLTGEYRIRSHKLLMIFAWGQQRVTPGEFTPGDSWREF